MSLITRFKRLFEADKLPARAGREDAAFDAVGAWGDVAAYANPDDLAGKKGLNIYAKMMTDEQVKSVVRFRRSAITSRNYDFEFTDDGMDQLPEEEQAFRKELAWAVIRDMPGSFTDSMNGVLSAIQNGFSLTEKVYKLFEYDGRSWVGIQKLALRPADSFEMHADQHGNLTKLRQTLTVNGKDLDPAKFIHYVQNPDVNELWGQSELRAAYRAWFSKDAAIKNQNIFGARLAGGFVWAELTEDYSIQPNSLEEQRLKNAMATIQTKTSMIMPRGVVLHVEMPNSSDFFENKIAQEDKAIAKALLVPNLLGITEQGTTGSYSQSQTQLEAFMWTLDSEVTKLEETLNEQLFRELGEYNFGDGFYPMIKFKPLSQTARMEIAKVWLSFIQGKAVTLSEADEDWVRDMLGAPSRSEDDQQTTSEETPAVEGNPAGAEVEGQEELPDDETIVGNQVVSITAMSRAEKRVDFAAIDRKADVIAYQRTDELGTAMDAAIATVLGKLPDALTAEDVKVAFPASSTKAIQNAIKGTLRDAWDVGTQQSKVEIGKAERQAKKQFNKSIKMARLDEAAAKYFDAQSFALAGNLSSQATKIVQNEILNGIRYSKSTADVRKAIYERLASAGIISDATADAAGVGLSIKNAQHTLDTLIRTASFESINEARHTYYTDPALEGFVVALEYSSILDSRTTEICNFMGGASTGQPQVHATAWPGWNKYRPPNHYNCRALLTPVTQLDEWTESPEPTVEPQEGFA